MSQSLSSRSNSQLRQLEELINGQEMHPIATTQTVSVQGGLMPASLGANLTVADATDVLNEMATIKCGKQSIMDSHVVKLFVLLLANSACLIPLFVNLTDSQASALHIAQTLIITPLIVLKIVKVKSSFSQ